MLFQQLPALEVSLVLKTLMLLAASIPPYLFYNLFLAGKIPKGLPWAGSEGKGVFRPFRSVAAALRDFPGTVLSAHKEFLAQGSAYVLSTVLDGPIIMLPPHHIRWLVVQPVKFLDFVALQSDRVQLDYVVIDKLVVSNPLYKNLCSKILKRQHASADCDFTDIREELQHTWDQAVDLADTNGWKSICLFPAMKKCVATGANRMLVGYPQCRDETYLAAISSYTQWFLPAGMTIRMAPRFVRPLLGRMFRPILQRHYATFVRHVSPVIEQYLSGGTPSEKSPISADTLIGWYLAEARKLPDASEAVKLETMASLILSLNFAALHSTTITCTDVVINILSYESVQELIQILRDEIKHVLEGTNGSWSLASLDKMHRLDSVVRETLRLDGVDGVSLHRLVKGDITGEDGLVLQKGTKIGVSSYSIHRDEVQYPNGMKFDPFRFSRPFDKMSQSEPCYEDSVPGVQDYSHSATEHFLPFGYGSQACPGRWFATAMIKMLVAHILLDYDIKLVGVKPKTAWIGTVIIPPRKVQVMVRRRGKEY